MEVGFDPLMSLLASRASTPATDSRRPSLTWLALLPCIALALALTSCRGPSKDKWSSEMEARLPGEFCKTGAYFVECFDITIDQCKDTSRDLIRQCLSEYRDQLPDRFDEDKGRVWGTKIGMCAGSRYDQVLASKFLGSDKCRDPSAWVQ